MYPNPCFAKINTPYVLWRKVAKKIWVTFAIFEKLPRVNNHPKGKNSPNLVTMAAI
jgi:hypothetical protein